MSTNVLSAKDIKRNWHLIDAKGKILGRLTTEVATKLIGKHNPNYVPYLDNGDFVVLINVSLVKVSGKKEQQRTYFRHSGYPGGDKVENFKRLINRRPEEVIRHAVKGMLPKTKLGRQMIKKLYVFSDDKHTFERQLGTSRKSQETREEGGMASTSSANI